MPESTGGASTGDTAAEFWTLLCDLRPFLVVGWSLSLLFVAISLLLLVTDATDQDPILVVNVVMLTPVVVFSGLALKKCQGR